MGMTRRDFVKNGVAAFTVSFAAPAFLSDLARAQGASSRNLVVLDLTGGNDGLSMLVPYTDAFYYSRRPTLAIPAGTVLQVGSRLERQGARPAPEADRVARHLQPGTPRADSARRLRELEPLAFFRHRHLVDGESVEHHRQRLGGPLPVDAAAAARSARRLEHDRRHAARAAVVVGVGGLDSQRQRLRVQQPEHRATRRRSSGPLPRASRRTCRWTSRTSPSSARSAQAAMATLDRVASVGHVQAEPSRIRTTASARRCRRSPARWRRASARGSSGCRPAASTRTRRRTPNSDAGAYVKLMVTLNDGLTAFYNDLQEPGTAERHAAAVVLGVRAAHHRERQQGHRPRRGQRACSRWAAACAAACTAPRRRSTRIRQNPTLENNAGDVHYETDFRSVYAKVIDNWLGGDSVGVLGGNFRKSGIDFV